MINSITLLLIMRPQKLLLLISQSIIGLMLCSLNLAYAAEPPTEPILRFDLGEHTATISRIASDEAGRYLVTASADKTARVWNLADGRLLNTLRIPVGSGNEGKLNAVTLSPDGQMVALGGWTQVGDAGVSIFLFDRASGRLLRRLTGLPNVIFHLAFSPDGRLLAAMLGGNSGLCLFSVSDGRLLAQDTDYGANSFSVHFNPAASGAAAQLLTTSLDGFLRQYHFDGQRLSLSAKRAAPGGVKPNAARFSPDGKRIAVGFNDTPAVNVLDAADLSLLAAPDTAGVNAELSKIAWSPDGQTLFAAGKADKQFEGNWHTYLRHWPSGGLGAPQDEPVANNVIMDLLGLPGGRVVFGSGEPSWGVVDGHGQRTLFHASLVADFRGNQLGFDVSPNGALVRFGYESRGRSPSVFDSRTRAFLAADSAGLTPPLLKATGLNVTDWFNTFATKLNGTLLKLGQNEMSRSLALLPDGSGFALGTVWYLRLFDYNGTQRWQQAAPGEVNAVNVSQDGRWVVAAYGDGTIRWHRASDGAEQFAFFPHADKKRWVLWTPSGYYDASPGAEELIGWHVNRGKDHAADFFPASRFRDRFYRPDVLAKVLQTQDEAEAVRLANEESGRRTQTITAIAQVLPPVVEIVSPASDTSVQPGTIKVRYTVRTAADAPVTAMRVRVNGLLQSNARALKLIANKGDTQEIEVTIPEPDAGIQASMRALKLAGQAQDSEATSADRPVEIQLFAENKFSTSTPAILRLQYAGKVTTKQGVSSKPKLYVLAVGVSKYKNPDYNLGLAAKDAQDFVNSLKSQKGKLYSDVVVKLLTDEQATRDDVLEGLGWLEQNVKSSDVGIMFVAGHGMNDKLGGYYFLPHNVDIDKLKSTAVSQNDIKQTFANLPGHTVFFIDTCYSGGALGSVRTAGFVNDLASAENGAVVFTASSAGQESQENESWGNGAFTKSVVEGLNGSADFRKSGFITAKGLDYYVDDRVKSLTNGKQTPVTISPGGVSDFPITQVER
jgi:WD40 repeat protein